MALVERYIDTVQKTYIAYCGRPADPVGLAYWTNQLDMAGGSLSAIINAFGNSSEVTTLLANMSYEQRINKLYNHLFGRDADDAGLAYYSLGLTNGTFTLSSIAMDIMNGTIGSDVPLLANKLASARLFTTSIDTSGEILAYNSTAIETARTWLSGVTTAAASQTSVDAILSLMTFPASLVESGGQLVLSGLLSVDLTLNLGVPSLLIDGASYALASGSLAAVNSVDASGLTGSGLVSFTGGASAETYIASSGGDTIRGAGGADTLTGGAGADHYLFEATAATNGLDVIYGITAGGSDVLDFSAFLNVTNTANIDVVDALSTGEAAWENGAVIVVVGDGLTTAPAIAALFGAGLPFAAPTARGKAVVIAADIVGDAGAWYLVNQTDLTNVTAAELTQVAVLNGVNNIGLVPFVAENFA